MNESSHGIVTTLLSLPIFEAEWVLWLLIGLSVLSVAVMVERAVFYKRHAVDVSSIRGRLAALLGTGDYRGAADLLAKHDSMETNVARFGVESHRMGPDAVEDLLMSTAKSERSRYEKRLGILATVASNAPFVGLFGTVLGIIRAFKDLAGNMNEASDAVMAGIAEALVATAVGLMVAIPAVVAFNYFKSKVNGLSDNTMVLASTLTSNLKSLEPLPAAAGANKEEV